MFILFLCAILWNITDCSVTPPANFHAWDDDDWRWWWQTTRSPYIIDHDYSHLVESDSSLVTIIIIIVTLFGIALGLACRFYCKECRCDEDESTSRTLHPPPRRAVPPPRDRTRQTLRDTDSVDSYLRDRFPIPAVHVQSSPASTGASTTNSIFRVDLFSYSNDINADDNNSVQNRNSGSDKPPGYSYVIRNDSTRNNFPVVKPTVPESPPPKYDDQKY